MISANLNSQSHLITEKKRSQSVDHKDWGFLDRFAQYKVCLPKTFRYVILLSDIDCLHWRALKDSVALSGEVCTGSDQLSA